MFKDACNQVRDDIACRGGSPMWKTGRSLLKLKFTPEQEAGAGELTARIPFAEGFFGYDDAIYPSLRVIENVSRQGSLDSFFAGLPRTRLTPEIQVACPHDRGFDVVKKGADSSRWRRQVKGSDGFRVASFDRWGLLRSSNSQPALVARFEAAAQPSCGAIRATCEDQLREFAAV